MASILLWRDLDRLVQRTARRFGLGAIVLRPHSHAQARDLGQCRYPPTPDAPAVIVLRVHRLGRPQVPLAPQTILRTLAHELAHLTEYPHGPAHTARTRELLAYMEEGL